jgi:uncharacterized protein YjbJ (UPF0337 family)
MGELIDKMKGKLKQIEGDLTGDRKKHAEGRLDELKGDLKGAFEDAKHGVKQALHDEEKRQDAEPVAPDGKVRR